MNEMTINRTSSRARIPQQECHGEECASTARNNYYLGKRLTPDSYRVEQLYAIERRRLINRAVHGWGVVYGFALSTDDPGGHSGELQIKEGLALDKLGRELVQVHSTWLSLDNLLLLDGDDRLVRHDGCLDERFEDNKSEDGCWMLTAHYAEKKIGHARISDPCRCDREEWDRTCETVVYSLKPVDCGTCCEPVSDQLKCRCPPDTLCCSDQKREVEEYDRQIREFRDRYAQEIAQLERLDARKANQEIKRLEEELEALVKLRDTVESRRHARGGCACLCEHLTDLKVAPDCAGMTDVDDCTHADLGNGVSLACVRLEQDGCGKWSIRSIVDACGPRRLVKRNDLLFDLISGADATTIIETGWAKWHRRSVPPVPFKAFQDALGWTGDRKDAEYPTRDFWVSFSRPVVADTLKPDIFAMAVMSDHSDDFWRTYVRVPIMAVETDRDANGLATRAKVLVGTNWLRDAVGDRDHMFAKGQTRIEIEVRGDLIVDCLGQQVDANSRGRSPAPTGNGSPGGSYFSSFTVARRKERESPESPSNRQQSSAPAPVNAPSDNRIR